MNDSKNLTLYQRSQILKFSNIFNELSDEQLLFLAKYCTERNFSKQEVLLLEGEAVNELFVIIDGKVNIVKKAKDEGENHILLSLGSGTCVGELEILGKKISSASVVAQTSVTAISINYDSIYDFIKNDKEAYKLLIQLGKHIGDDLRNTNIIARNAIEKQLIESKIRIALGTATVGIVTWVCLYSFMIQWLKMLSSKNTTWITVPLMFVLLLNVLRVLLKSGISMKDYGFTLDGWKESLFMSVSQSFIVVALFVLLKYILINFVPEYANIKLIVFSDMVKKLADHHVIGDKISYFTQIKWWMFYFFIYCFYIAPIQEFITKCGIQASLEIFLVGKFAKLQAMLVANLVFAIFHLFISFNAAILSFFAAILWGYLFSRNKTIVGPISGHILVGGALLFVVGVPGF